MTKKERRARRTFMEYFKLDPVNPVALEACSMSAAAKTVYVFDGSLREWRRKYSRLREDALVEELEVENTRLLSDLVVAVNAIRRLGDFQFRSQTR